MTRSLTDPTITTTTRYISQADLEIDLADDFAERIESYSDLLLFRAALRGARRMRPHGVYFYVQETASAPEQGSLTALSLDPILWNFRTSLNSAIASLATAIHGQPSGIDYLYEDEPASDVIFSELSKVQVLTESDIDLPWA